MEYNNEYKSLLYSLIRNKRRDLRKQGQGWSEGRQLEFLCLHAKNIEEFLKLVKIHDSDSRWKWAITLKRLISEKLNNDKKTN